MSFGYSVGDCIVICQLANQLRERFADAPSQFKAISNEVTGLSNVLQDVERVLSQQMLTDWQKKALASVLEECHNVLIALGKVVDENYFLSLSNVHGFRNKSRRAWKRLTWEPDDIREFRSRVALNIGLLNAFNGSLISKVTLATKDEVERLHERQNRRERQEEDQAILNWLTPIDYAAQQSDFISRRQEGTGQWLLESAEFRAWIETDQQTLFCPGMPGAGKTILTSIVVEDLTARFRDDKSIGIAYLYCNFRRQDEQNIDELLASLLKQLAESQLSLPGSVKDLYDRYKTKRTRPSQKEISETIHIVTKSYSRVFVIVDALDECQVSHGCRMTFLSELFSLQAKYGAKLFATSRFILEISENFKGSIQLEIRARKEDVQTYLDHHISPQRAFLRKNLALQNEIKAKIIEAVKGMFLLAQLHLDSLMGRTTESVLRSALQNLPTGSNAYDQAYKDAMERITAQDADGEMLAKQVLSWITCAKQPLTTAELQHALAVKPGISKFDETNQPDIEDIVSVCAGLVTIEEESNIIRLVHYTTQEYFDRTREEWFPNAETNITIICVTYLSFDDFESGICQSDEEFEQRLQSNWLYHYASHNWGHHAGEASLLTPEVISFLETKAQVEASSQALMAVKLGLWDSKYSQNIPTQMTGLHLAAYFGVDEAVQSLTRSDGPDSEDSYGRTPLSWAAENGHEAVVKLLLDKGAELETKDTSYDQTPLLWAAENGHKAVVKLLLDKGAELETKDTSGRTPLSWAAWNGHEAVVKLLLDKGAELETKDTSGRTPLSWAAENRQEAVVKLLLDKGAELETKDTSSRTPLLWAAWNGYKAVVKLMLDKGAELETKDTIDDRTPLSWAAENGHEAVVKLLLDKSAELETKDTSGRTPLSWAARNGHEAVVKLLLDKGAELETKDTSGRTPLPWAVENGHKAVVKLLLDKGAEPETKDTYGRTPLSWAAWKGHEIILKLLLNKGAEPETKDTNFGRTPLSLAAWNGHKAVVKLLLDKGAELETKDTSGRTPLSLAAENRQEAVVKLLLDKGAELETKDTSGRTPLPWAVENGHKAVVKLLLDKGAEPETKDTYGRTPLSWAAWNGHEAVVKLLLDKGTKPETKDTDFGQIPLSLAARNGHETVVKLLLDKGAEQEIKDTNYGRTPLSLAAENGHETIVKLLLATGVVDADVKDNLGRTPLWWAARDGNAAVKLLLATDRVNVDSVDYYNSTPLSVAARMGHRDVVTFLLSQSLSLNVKDNFGRTPLWWARRNGHLYIADLLLDKYKENGIPIQEVDLPTTIISVPSDNPYRYCDICVLGISEEDAYYHCGVCNGGNFDICEGCFTMKAYCLDQSHTLIKE